MKMKLIFACVIVATIGFVCPDILTKETSILEYAIAKRDQMTHKRGTTKRDVIINIRTVFDWIDQNKDGHITADEFANWQHTHMPTDGITYNMYKDVFSQAMRWFDYNGNSQLEINEYKVLTERVPCIYSYED